MLQNGIRANLSQYGVVRGRTSSLDVTKWYQSRPLPVRCGSGTNQAEAGGHVTPTAWLSISRQLDTKGSRQLERALSVRMTPR
jgi:hypothetical protein